jgi:hypothetical protein
LTGFFWIQNSGLDRLIWFLAECFPKRLSLDICLNVVKWETIARYFFISNQKLCPSNQGRWALRIYITSSMFNERNFKNRSNITLTWFDRPEKGCENSFGFRVIKSLKWRWSKGALRDKSYKRKNLLGYESKNGNCTIWNADILNVSRVKQEDIWEGLSFEAT